MHISNLHIENYKSIKDLKLKTKRVNIFIGEPNSGKTNIIEAMSLLSFDSTSFFKEIIRFDSVDELFPDSDISEPIKIFTDNLKFTIEYHKNESGAVMNEFLCRFYEKDDQKHVFQFDLDFDGKIRNQHGPNFPTNICFYSFKRHKTFNKTFRPFLNPPFGDNIPSLLLSNKELKKLVSDIFKDKGFKLELKPKESKMAIAKDVEGDIYSYPYFSVSETLQRIVFMLLAIETNKDKVLLFDEPESNTFPFYTKYIAERIALDKTNQYFLTTHNPYLLMSLIEKTPSKELNVIVTTMKKFQTKCYPLNSKQVEKAQKMGYDMLFNIDKFTKE